MDSFDPFLDRDGMPDIPFEDSKLKRVSGQAFERQLKVMNVRLRMLDMFRNALLIGPQQTLGHVTQIQDITPVVEALLKAPYNNRDSRYSQEELLIVARQLAYEIREGLIDIYAGYVIDWTEKE